MATGGQSRSPFVHVFKWLQVGQVHHHEKRLLERIANGSRFHQDLCEALLGYLDTFGLDDALARLA